MATRSLQLDGLRGLAVLTVLTGHVAESVVPYGGVVGVQLFFVLSGFLITRGLLDEHERTGRIALGGFWVRRAARLLPAFAVVVATTAVAVVVLQDPTADRLPSVLGTVATYTANWARVLGVQLGPFDHTWSLAVEEQFYLLWPLAVLAWCGYRARRPRAAKVVAVLVVGMAAAWRLVLVLVFPYDHVAYGLDGAAFGLIAGAVAAGVGVDVRSLPRRWSLVVLAAVVLLPVCTLPWGLGPADGATRWVSTAAAVAAVPLVHAAVRDRVPVLSSGVLRWFGTISYGLYLWHYPLLALQPDGHPQQGAVRLVLAVLAVGLAAASWYALESPVLRAVRRRRVSDRARAGTITVAR